LSNQVEETFLIDPRKADTDHDGIDDGLEFVGENGDPLDANKAPRPFNRRLSLTSRATTTGDADQDGLSNNYETEVKLDENEPDFDGDGYSDSIELLGLSDPFLADDRPTRDAPPAADGVPRVGSAPTDGDGDGLADATEGTLGSRSDVADTDSDGFADGIEYLMGSALTDAFSVPNFTVPARAET
jgi:hypothetical protein